MERRNFIRMIGTGLAAGVIAPKAVLAASAFDPFKAPAAGGLYYTADAPGRWSKKIKGHLPNFERAGNKLEIVTGHPMDDYKHYIVKHQLFDQDFNLLSEKMFDPMTDGAVSMHDISGRNGRLYALSVCNIHDSWLNYIDV